MSDLVKKTAASLIIFVFVLTIAAYPLVIAATHEPGVISTVAKISINPKTVGVLQTVLVTGWVLPCPNVTGTVYKDIIVTFTKPDGTKDQIQPMDSYESGTIWFEYHPEMIGDWSAVLSWAGAVLYPNGTVETSTHTGSTSPPFRFVVQENPVDDSWPPAELPDYPWQRPISAELREWSVLGGAWMETGRNEADVMGSCFNPYSTSPGSAHILWKIQTGMGGLIGGEYESQAYSATAPSKVIMYGRAYFSASDGVHCVDVHTGKELWVPAKTMGSGTMYAIPGPTPYIWRIGASRFERFDAFTGSSTKNVTGQPAGLRINRQVMDSNGMLYLNIDDSQDNFQGQIAYNTTVSSTNFYGGVVWNVQRVNPDSTAMRLYNYPYGNSTGVIVENFTMPIQSLSNIHVYKEGGVIYNFPNGGHWTAAWDLKTGKLLWNMERDVQEFEGCGGVTDGVAVAGTTCDMKIYGFDVKTGKQVWVSEPALYPWGGFRSYQTATAYSKFYFSGYDGYIRAYNAKNGTTAWEFYCGDAGSETPYGTWPFYTNPAVAGGKVFAANTEHSPTMPVTRGNRLYALDAETGDLLWSIAGCNNHLAIADGVLVASDGYTPIMYGFDKGTTATTVSASPKICTNGSSILIEGTVIDMSPAQPNTPAISDASMSAWMEYLHMQRPVPDNATGVYVKLTAIDSNNNRQDIGSVQSTTGGFFSATWEPPVPGKYTVTATLQETESYWPSYAETAFSVAEPNMDFTAVEAATSADNTVLLYGILAAVVVAIVIGLVAILLVLRKH